MAPLDVNGKLISAETVPVGNWQAMISRTRTTKAHIDVEDVVLCIHSKLTANQQCPVETGR